MPATKCSKLNLIVVTIGCSLLFTLVHGIIAAHAVQIIWQNKPYNHYSRKEEIKEVLTDFFASQGIGVICSENVKGTISGNFKEKDPQAFFKHITDAYNLVWYYDGAAVYIYSAHEMTSTILNPGFLNMRKFQQHLTDLGIYDPKFPMRMIERERIIYLSGPQRYVDLITEMVAQLDAKAMAHGGMDDIVQIFPLKHAWADDKTILFRDKEMVIPGVATMLNNLIAGATSPSQVVGGKPQNLLTPLNKLKGKGLRRYRPKDDSDLPSETQMPEASPSQNQRNSEGDPQEPSSQIEIVAGSIQPDPRQNAVVVRDREEKMPYYKQIIDLLDAPVNLVEIRATIMDINRNDLKELGIQWEFLSTRDNGEANTKGGLNTNELFSREDGLVDGLQLPTGSGLNLATILGDATDFFLAKVNALQDKGHAKILSRPSVLTLNNIEAQLEHSQTFYVRLAGEREVDLYDISSGVVLRVTPHIIEEKKGSLVKLAIQIEDGELTNETVDDIPVVSTSVVNTQAVVGQDESLLIGGYKKERNSNRRQGIPCLADVPLLGWLFRRNSSVVEDSERLFLITPTIVPYGLNNQTTGQGGNAAKLDVDDLRRTELETENTVDTTVNAEIRPHGLPTTETTPAKKTPPLAQPAEN